MSTEDLDSLVAVYTTPLAFDAEIVKSMLADEEIPSTVENASGPFPGLTTIPCQVMVTKENENFARRLIEEHEELHRKRVELESEEECVESEPDEDESMDV